MVRNGEGDLIDKLNASIAKLQSDGTIKQILAKWGIS